MKHLMIFAVLAFATMFRSDDKSTYTVVAQNASADPAQLVIDNKTYTVTQSGLKKEVEVDEYKVSSLSLGYAEAGTESLILSVYKGDELITSVSGNTYMYVILSRDSTTNGGGGMYHHRRVYHQQDELYL